MVEDALYEGAQVFVRSAQAKVPKRTGNLRDAIIAKRLQRQGSKPAPVLYTIDRKKAPYAYLVNILPSALETARIINGRNRWKLTP